MDTLLKIEEEELNKILIYVYGKFSLYEIFKVQIDSLLKDHYIKYLKNHIQT